jgi:predicted nucleic acid-binding protein
MDQVLIDTNVLVYVHQTDDQVKQARAIEVVERLAENKQGRLSTQVLGEFVRVTTAGKRATLTIKEARGQLDALIRMFVIFDVTRFTVLEAARGVQQHQLSYYDAQIWATAMLRQVPIIYTEDFTDGRVVEGVQFVNPFLH